VTYLLDTNACIALVGGRPPEVRVRLDRALAKGQEISVPAIAAFELWYGVGKSARPEPNAERLQLFLERNVGLMSFDHEDARIAGGIHAELESSGKSIGAYDYLIAGMAVRHRLILVTANVREFARVRGLSWEDWSRR